MRSHPQAHGLLHPGQSKRDPVCRYGKPEALRTVVPLTACPVEGATPFHSREQALKCETFAFMQPRPKLMRALVPLLHRLERFDIIVGVHLRTGCACTSIPPRHTR